MRFRRSTQQRARAAMQGMVERMRDEGLQLSPDGTEWVPIPNTIIRSQPTPPGPTLPAPPISAEVIDVNPPPPPADPPPRLRPGPRIGVTRIVRQVHEILTDRTSRAIGAPIDENEEAATPSAAPAPQGRPLTPVELRLVARSGQETALKCPICHDAIDESQDSWARCGGCQTLYHGECWENQLASRVGKCATLGCAGTTAAATQEDPLLTRAREAARQREERHPAAEFAATERQREERRRAAESALEIVAEALRENDEQIREGERLIAENKQKLMLAVIALVLFLLGLLMKGFL